MDPEEFNDVVKRVHTFLIHRVEKAKEKRVEKPSPKSERQHVEATKDAFVFVHMMQLIEQMSEEISDLRDILDSISDSGERKSPVSSFEMFSKPKKFFPN